MSKTLLPLQLSRGKLVFYFSSAPEYVPTGIVIVYVPSGRGIPPYTGYQFTLGDYIKLEEVQGLPASDKSRVLSPESRIPNH